MHYHICCGEEGTETSRFRIAVNGQALNGVPSSYQPGWQPSAGIWYYISMACKNSDTFSICDLLSVSLTPKASLFQTSSREL